MYAEQHVHRSPSQEVLLATSKYGEKSTSVPVNLYLLGFHLFHGDTLSTVSSASRRQMANLWTADISAPWTVPAGVILLLLPARTEHDISCE